MALSFVASDTLRAPVHVRLSLVPELFDYATTDDDDDDVEYNRGGCSKKAVPYTEDEDWPSDRAWAEAERMLSVTTVACALALSAAWCLMLLTALGGVLGIRNILSGY